MTLEIVLGDLYYLFKSQSRSKKLVKVYMHHVYISAANCFMNQISG